jgi:threonine/homoserine/homoserine lactone efflux protein
VDPDAYGTSFGLIGLIFLALEVVAVLVYALLGQRVGALGRKRNLFGSLNRLSGLTMIGFGVALLFTRRPA